MASNITTNDWQFATILSGGASALITSQFWLLSFRSKSTGVWNDFVLGVQGVNIAAPGANLDLSLPSFGAADLSWSDIQCNRPFSMQDLDGAGGSLWCVGVGAGFAGYSDLYLSAFIDPLASYARGSATVKTEYLFESQRNNGYSVGISSELGGSSMRASGRFTSVGTIITTILGNVAY